VYADGTDLVYVGRPEELRKYAITKNKFELEFDTPEFFMDDWDAKVFGDLYYAAHNERLDVTDFPQTFKTILSTRISTYWPKQIKFTKIPTEAKPHQLMFATTKVKQSWAPSMIGAVNLGSTVERKIIRKYATSQES
jgi:hypothetical protein